MDEKKNNMPSAEDFLLEEPPLAEEPVEPMPELTLYPSVDLPQEGDADAVVLPIPQELQQDPVILRPEPVQEPETAQVPSEAVEQEDIA